MFDFVRLLAGQIGFPEVVTSAEALINEIIEPDATAADLTDDGLAEVLAENPAQAAVGAVVIVLGLDPVRRETAMADGDERSCLQFEDFLRHQVLVKQRVSRLI